MSPIPPVPPPCAGGVGELRLSAILLHIILIESLITHEQEAKTNYGAVTI